MNTDDRGSSETLGNALKFDARFNDPKFEKMRSKAAHALLTKQNEEEAGDVFDFFDSVGLFVRLGALKEEIAYAVFFHWTNLCWRAGKNHVGAKQKDTASVWKDFERLYHQVSEIEKLKHADSEDLKMTADRPVASYKMRPPLFDRLLGGLRG